MKKKFIVFLLFSFSCLIQIHAQINWTGKINVFIGDSNTEGTYSTTPNPDEQRFSAVLSAMKGSIEDNRGLGGRVLQHEGADSHEDCPTPKMELSLIPHKTDDHLFLYIKLGANDIAHANGGFNASAFTTRLEEVVDHAIAEKGWPSTNIILVSPPWANLGTSTDTEEWWIISSAYDLFYDRCNVDVLVTEERQLEYVNAVQSVAATKNVVFADLYHALKNSPNRLDFIGDAYEEIHFNVAGHQFIANFLANFDYPIALPLNLVDFSATKQNTSIHLRWISENEVNTHEFVVERADNRMQFQPIGKVQASGNSADAVNYQFEDAQPLPGNNIYRLKMLDLDGKFEYSKVAMAKSGLKLSYSVSPNPAKKNVVIVSEKKERLQLHIIDMSGRIVKTAVSTDQLTTLKIDDLRKGLYIIKIVGGDEVFTQKLVVE